MEAIIRHQGHFSCWSNLENDVKMYGIQTNIRGFDASDVFENDVKT